jgi:uncharacterized GH25 family protein
LSCGYSSNTVAALLGRGDLVPGRPVGDLLEIVPLVGAASAGEAIRVRVLLRGRPWQGEVSATYAGFTGAEDEYPVRAATDHAGEASLPLDRPGRWMIKAAASEAYPDPAICDRSNYTATLTLVVR